MLPTILEFDTVNRRYRMYTRYLPDAEDIARALSARLERARGMPR